MTAGRVTGGPLPPLRALSYLALGDSYSIGEGIDASGCWPVQLARALRDEGVMLADPKIVATTGWTTDELSAALDAVEPLGTRGFVSLLIGVNDQYRGRGADGYRDGFAELLERSVGYAGGRTDRVLVLSIPDWGVTPFATGQGRDAAQIASELDAYNTIACGLCMQLGIAFVDITPMSRERGAEIEMLADDGLHPSAAMYAEWVRIALPVARGLLAP